MSINLTKGTKINLSKDGPSGVTVLHRVRLGLGWTPQAKPAEGDFDLDSSIFCLNDQGKITQDEHFVFYGNKVSPDAAVVHMGDNRKGADAGSDAERILVDLTRVDPAIKKLSLIITIDEAKKRHQNFGRVKDSYVSLYDEEAQKEFARYILEDEAPDSISVHFGEFERQADGNWTFTAVGQGYDKELGDFVKLYGGDVA